MKKAEFPRKNSPKKMLKLWIVAKNILNGISENFVDFPKYAIRNQT